MHAAAATADLFHLKNGSCGIDQSYERSQHYAKSPAPKLQRACFWSIFLSFPWLHSTCLSSRKPVSTNKNKYQLTSAEYAVPKTKLTKRAHSNGGDPTYTPIATLCNRSEVQNLNHQICIWLEICSFVFLIPSLSVRINNIKIDASYWHTAAAKTVTSAIPVATENSPDANGRLGLFTCTKFKSPQNKLITSSPGKNASWSTGYNHINVSQIAVTLSISMS